MRTLLIDGDELAYRYAFSAEKPIDWGGLWTLHADEDEAKANLDSRIEWLQEKLEAESVKVALTGSNNWRNAIYPPYKTHRKDARKPILLPILRQHLIDKHGAFVRPTLEGDDIIGIFATMRAPTWGERIIVSFDKDMKTIPGLHFDTKNPDSEVFEVTPDEANRWHMLQTLTGDASDGYPGLPGVGPKRAEAILADYSSPVGLWTGVVAAYEKAKLTEADALVQARVARICHACNYDFNSKKVKLWTPPT